MASTRGVPELANDKLHESDYEGFDELPDWQKDKIRRSIEKRKRRVAREKSKRNESD